MKKRIISFLTSLVMVISLVGVVPSMTVSASGGVYQKFCSQVLSVHPDGSTGASSFSYAGTTTCHALVSWATQVLFGQNIYQGRISNTGSNYTCVYAGTSIWDAISHAKCGDVFKYTNSAGSYAYHSALFIADEGSNAQMYERVHDNFKLTHYNKNNIFGYISSSVKKVYVYHANNYDSVDGTHTCNSGRSVVTRNPTCTSNGVRTYYCTVCGRATKTESISAYGHNIQKKEVAPSASENGYILQYYTRCNYQQKSYTWSSVAIQGWYTAADIHKTGYNGDFNISIIDNTPQDDTNEYLIRRRNLNTNEVEIVDYTIDHRKNSNQSSFDAAGYVAPPKKPGLYIYNVSVKGNKPNWCDGKIQYVYGDFSQQQHTVHDGKLYTICSFNDTISNRWLAYKYCTDHNSTLASSKNETENNVIKSIVSEFGYPCLLSGVIGMNNIAYYNKNGNNIQNRKWKWFDGSEQGIFDYISNDPQENCEDVIYTNWGTGQPNKGIWTNYLCINYTYYGNSTDPKYTPYYTCYENHIAMNPDGKWNDVGNFDASIKGFVMESNIEKIESIDAIKSYTQGDDLIIKDVKGKFSNGVVESLEEFDVVGYNANKIGNQTVTIKYKDKSFTFNVEVKAKHTHSYTSKITKQPTCTTTGVKTFTCSCGDSYTEKIPATGHKYVDTVVKPTYLAQGYTLHKCSVCGDEYKDNYTAKLVLANVTGFKASSTSANAVKLTWKKSSGANGYVVYRYNTSTKKYGRIAKITSNTYTDKKLKSGTNYKYAVRAYRTVNGKELLSPSYPQITTSTNPATVSFKLTAGTKKATVKWSKVTGASGYKIYYKTSKNGKWVGLKTVNNKTTNYTKTKLASKKTYYFTVKAYRTTGGKTYNGAYTTKSVKIK